MVMNSILYSENLKIFSSNFKNNVNSADDCYEKLQLNLPLIAEDLKIGRFDIRIDAPVSIYDAEGYLIDYPIYRDENGYGIAPLQFPYDTYEHGHILIRVFPKKDYTWNDIEKEELEILSRNVFFMCGRARLIDLMKKVVVTDNATGIPNTQGLMEFAKQINENAQFSAYHAVQVNIKNFKYINRVISVKRSDEALREYARYIERHVEEDEIFARTSSDNFIGFIKNENIQKFLERIAVVRIYADTNCNYMELASRAGVYDIQVGDTIGDILTYVETALNQSRSQNEDVVFFEHVMMEKLFKSKEVLALFPMAISKKQFEVYYQPKVNILNQSLCGCEALVRWIRNGAIVNPMEFIPVLEQEGTICILDFFVFERVCETIKAWTEKGIEPVRVSVNFSRNHLKNPDLSEKIFALIDKYGVDPNYLEIELTEMCGYDNYDRLTRFIKEMRGKGVHISIDDFGTGYSSLNLLTELDVDTVKLDRSYSVRLENEEEKTKILIHNIVNMVHELGYTVIAEGVERKEQIEFLRGIGCSTVQGYLYDKPLPLEEFEKRLSGQIKYE